jgi:flavin reductase (DIM6/NTAB) family NADH-FMN oxidoreductase RutF
MDWNFATLEAAKRYKLLAGLVIPRPIALVTSLSSAGVVNAAPFSFFNVMADDPPIVIVSIEYRIDGRLKDSGRNIIDSGEFVVNLVDESIAERMHGCAADYPPEVSEIEAVGFTTAPSCAVAPPRIAEAPVALECKLHQRITVKTRDLVIGEVVWLHTREGIVDPDTLRIRTENYFPVARFYANRYARTRDQFTVEANAYNEAMKRLGRA